MFYPSLLIISAVFMAKRKTINSNKLFFCLFILTFAVMSATIRLTLENDFISYNSALKTNSLQFYYIREPVVWLGQRYFFSILQSAYWTFVAFDLIIALVLYKALQRIDLPQYAYFSFLAFFPFVMGFNNIYRQWVASIFFLYAFTLIRDRTSWAWLWYFLSILSHNVAGVFIGLLFVNHTSFFKKTVFIFLLLLTPVLISFGGASKAGTKTGASLELAYLALIIAILIFYAASDKLKIKFADIKDYKFLWVVLYISGVATLFLSSGIAERVSIFSLMLIYPYLVLKIETNFKQKYFLRLIFAISGLLPLFLFSSGALILK